MSLSFINTFRGMITDPGETIRKSRSATLGDSIIYFLIVIFIYSVLTALIALLLGPINPMPFQAVGNVAEAAVFLVSLVIGGTLALLIVGGIIHICVKIVGGSGDYTATVRAFAIAESPQAAIGWIPLIGFIACIWALVLMVMGVSEYHKISTLRAVIAVLLPLLVIVILAVLGLMFFMIAPTSMTVTQIS